MQIIHEPESLVVPDNVRPEFFDGLFAHLPRVVTTTYEREGSHSWRGPDGKASRSVSYWSSTNNEQPAFSEARVLFGLSVNVNFDTVMVNRYSNPYVLPFHTDTNNVRSLAILSLGASCEFFLRPFDPYVGPVTREPGPNDYKVVCEHGDVVFLNARAQQFWMHGGIMPANRYSIVWRQT